MNFVPVEPQPYCPGCDGAIPQEALQRRPVAMDQVVRPTHWLFGYCEHCDRLWKAKRELMPHGHYEIVEGPIEVTDDRVKRPIVASIMAKRGHTPLHA